MSCEWNPNENRDCYANEKSHAQATVFVGDGNDGYHLCKQCSNLPRFKSLRKRTLPTKACEVYYPGEASEEIPIEPGLYVYRCDETERKWYHAAVFVMQEPGVLVVAEESSSGYLLEHFHDNLTDIEWLKVS
jgi:hypothetical protein